MPAAQEIARELLHCFAANVVARRSPSTYGEYAHAIGRDPADYGIAVGQAMHVLGALFVFRQIPVAPLYWVRRADNAYRGIFESDDLERHFIIESGDIDVMYVVSREYHYSMAEFEELDQRLQTAFDSGKAAKWSPHMLWRAAFSTSVPGSDLTVYRRAMARYHQIFAQLKSERDG